MKNDGNKGKSRDEQSEGWTIKARVYWLLHENPLMTPKRICQLLHLDYKTYRAYVTKIKHLWKYDPTFQRGSKRSLPSTHAWRGWVYLPEGFPGLDLRGDVLVRPAARAQGWVESRARNRWLLWRDRLGRLQWFETGRVNIWVRKPVTWGKVNQLLVNGFISTELVTDLKVFRNIIRGVRFKGAHYVYPTGERLPQLVIDTFAESNGIVIKLGDRTHPQAVEVLASYPDWGERNERLFERNERIFEDLRDLLRELLSPPERKPGPPDRLGYIG